MPSLTDIPDELRSPRRKYGFLNWLARCPVEDNHKRTLINLWSREQGERVSAKARWLVGISRNVPDGT